MTEQLIPLGLLFCTALALIAVLLFVPPILGKKRTTTRQKNAPYECGMPANPLQGRFSVKFYLVAMLFILFDIEVVFILGWASVFKDLAQGGTAIFWQAVLFIAILEVGHLYLIKRGALNWAPRHSKAL